MYHSVAKDWPAETVFILGGGPSLNWFDCSRLKGRRVIAVNNAFNLVPFADVLFFMDNRWWRWYGAEARRFSGTIITVAREPQGLLRMRWTGRTGLETERDALCGAHTGVHFAINLAVHYGAARIVLLGVDMGSIAGQSHFHEGHRIASEPQSYEDMAANLATLVRPLNDLGIEIFNASPVSRLEAFPKRSIEDLLCSSSSAAVHH